MKKTNHKLIKRILIISFIIIILSYFVICNFIKKKSIEGFKSQTNPLSNLINKFYVINLSETSEGRRRLKVIKQHNILSKYIERFAGIYGKTHNYNNEIKRGIIQKSWDFGKWHGDNSKMIEMTDGEIGVSLSHYYLWKKIVDEKIPVTMVLEDDGIDLHPHFEELVIENMKYLPEDWDVFLLGYWLNKGLNGKKINEKIYKVDDFVLAHCYLITYEGAKKYLNSLPINMPLDSWMGNKSNYVNIYRHNFARNKKYKPSSLLIRQKRDAKQIVNTNNYNK